MAGSEPAQKVRPREFGGAEERRLVEAAQRDTARFIELYEKHFQVVFVYILRRVRERADAEDLTAEVFRKALVNLPRFKWTGAPFAAWLFRIASNLIADWAKRKMREGSATIYETEPARTVGNTKPKTQQSELEECERRAELFRSVDELAEDQRRVIMMRFAEEKSIREISEELGRSEGAVKQLQFRALENLRARIGEQSGTGQFGYE